MLVLDTRYDLRAAFVLDREKDFSRRAWYLGIPEMTDFRINAMDESGRYEVYGFWKGYDDNSLNASRDTTSPALLEGREYHLLYPIQGRARWARPTTSWAHKSGRRYLRQTSRWT